MFLDGLMPDVKWSYFVVELVLIFRTPILLIQRHQTNGKKGTLVSTWAHVAWFTRADDS